MALPKQTSAGAFASRHTPLNQGDIFRSKFSEGFIVRSHDWARHLVACWSKSTGMNRLDIEDAQQECLLALDRAIANLDLDRLHHGSDLSFRAFAYKVFRDRFIDYLRRFIRRESHLDRSWGARQLLEGMVDVAATDPAAMLVAEEQKRALAGVLDTLEHNDRFLALEYLSGRSLRAIAAQLGCRYAVTKRRWQTIARRLKKPLAAWNDQ